jgi:hypothetical protein
MTNVYNHLVPGWICNFCPNKYICRHNCEEINQGYIVSVNSNVDQNALQSSELVWPSVNIVGVEYLVHSMNCEFVSLCVCVEGLICYNNEIFFNFILLLLFPRVVNNV